MTTVESVLTTLEDFNLSFKSVVGALSFTSITVSGSTATINLTSTTGFLVGHYAYIGFGPNEGYHLITAVTSTTLVYSDAAAVAQSAGNGSIYQVKASSLTTAIANQTTAIEKYTGLSFSGVQTIDELHDGSGTTELMLDRRPVLTLENIVILSWPYTNYVITPSSIEVVGDQGMLRVKNVYDVGFTPIAPAFPKGRNNIKVTYTCGYTTAPAAVQAALVLMAAASILGTAAGQRGDASSLSVEGWSRSYGSPRGKYGIVRNDWVIQARALLRGYKSSVVGN